MFRSSTKSSKEHAKRFRQVYFNSAKLYDGTPEEQVGPDVEGWGLKGTHRQGVDSSSHTLGQPGAAGVLELPPQLTERSEQLCQTRWWDWGSEKGRTLAEDAVNESLCSFNHIFRVFGPGCPNTEEIQPALRVTGFIVCSRKMEEFTGSQPFVPGTVQSAGTSHLLSHLIPTNHLYRRHHHCSLLMHDEIEK